MATFDNPAAIAVALAERVDPEVGVGRVLKGQLRKVFAISSRSVACALSIPSMPMLGTPPHRAWWRRRAHIQPGRRRDGPSRRALSSPERAIAESETWDDSSMAIKKVDITSVEDLPGGFLARGEEVADGNCVANVWFAVAPAFGRKLQGCADGGEHVKPRIDDSKFLRRQEY